MTSRGPTREARGGCLVGAYSFGRIEIDGRAYNKDVLILPPDVVSPWWRREGHRLDMVDLARVVEYTPETLVVGTGAHGRMTVPEGTQAAVTAQGIDIEVMATEEAYRRFNALYRDGHQVAAAFHLTC